MYTGRVEEQEISATPPHTDPTHFPPLKKAFIVIAGLVSIFNSNLGSSLPSNAAAEIESYFSITQHQQMVLLNSLYLVGYTLGPLIFGPLSEHIGRRPVLSATYTLYLLFTVGCALAPTYGVLLLFRTLSGIIAAAPNAVVGALFADIFNDPTQRGRAIATFIVIATMGPAMGPVVSGCTADISWRLCFWVGLALAGVTWPLVLFLPETCQKVLQKRCEGHRGQQRESGPVRSQIPLTKELSMVFSRPFTMILKEPIVLFTSVYLGLVYSILYLFFQAYPIIFGGRLNDENPLNN
ncbi:hypothetical protein CcaCcLH18_09631 [Colletotrichum camelliae]|nr:hypothetical protein CcaCcLH18_09631 [Colletotrichum camelliae]